MLEAGDGGGGRQEGLYQPFLASMGDQAKPI
jgi:hypothetical protein